MDRIELPKPIDRNLFLAAGVDISSVNELTKSIIAINEHDEYISKIFSIHNLTYIPSPIKIHIDSYGGRAYQCLGLIGVMQASKT
jgi:hypothetical protein